MHRQLPLHRNYYQLRASHAANIFHGNEKCAKYTLRHKPQKLEMAWESETRVLASKLEYHIKKSLTKSQKEELIKHPKQLEKFLGDKIECQFYQSIL